MAEIDVELLFEEEREDIKSAWDKYVPILSDKVDTVTAYLNDQIDVPAAYNELIHTLENTEAKTVVLKINNGGGALDSFLSIREAIKRSNATVIADLSGTVASAATMIALSCDEIRVADHTSWMSHFYSGGTSGKGNEIKAQNKFMEKEMPRMFRDVHAGFFTKAEMTKIINGTDYWLNKDDILKRWEKKQCTEC